METNTLLNNVEVITTDELILKSIIPKTIVKNDILLNNVDSIDFTIKTIVKDTTLISKILTNTEIVDDIIIGESPINKVIIENDIALCNAFSINSLIDEQIKQDNPIIQENILLNQLEIPVHDNLITTSRPLNTDSISNDDLISSYENIGYIPPVNLTDGNYFSDDIGELPMIRLVKIKN